MLSLNNDEIRSKVTCATPLGGKDGTRRDREGVLIAQRRYIAKLQLLDLAEEDDPYAQQNSGKFVDDMSKWPAVEYGNIFCYYIERPGVYTRRHLMQWKSLEAYNYFKSGHVREVN